jgi:hypothetical protein
MNTIRNLSATAAAMSLATAALAQSANFDAETEGFKGQTFTSTGIRFFDCNTVNGFYPGPEHEPFTPQDLGTNLIVEDATVVHDDFPTFVSAPNTLTFGLAYVPGTNASLGPLAAVSLQPATPTPMSQAGFDIIYYENGPWGGIVVTVDALQNGQVVGTTSFTVSDLGGRDNPIAQRLSVSAASFDTVRITSRLNGDYTTLRALIDNVVLTPAGGTCYANCDQSTTAPVLNVLDFNCFLNRFSSGDSYANCDNSTVAPVLNVLDFNCFLNRFTAGCTQP